MDQKRVERNQLYGVFLPFLALFLFYTDEYDMRMKPFLFEQDDKKDIVSRDLVRLKKQIEEDQLEETS